jgi:hypothetical protein
MKAAKILLPMKLKSCDFRRELKGHEFGKKRREGAIKVRRKTRKGITNNKKCTMNKKRKREKK